MELFDKKFVHFMWEDELEGKEGFVADNICELTNCVLGGNFHRTQVRKSVSPSSPFRDTNNNNDWLFFYYDHNYKVKKAYNEGKQIQCRSNSAYKWIDDTNPTWEDAFEYRIKPTEEYRPYSSCDEMIDDYKHRLAFVTPNIVDLPLIWVKQKTDSHRYLVTTFGKDEVKLSNFRVTMKELFDDFIYLDGSIIGVKE